MFPRSPTCIWEITWTSSCNFGFLLFSIFYCLCGIIKRHFKTFPHVFGCRFNSFLNPFLFYSSFFQLLLSLCCYFLYTFCKLFHFIILSKFVIFTLPAISAFQIYCSFNNILNTFLRFFAFSSNCSFISNYLCFSFLCTFFKLFYFIYTTINLFSSLFCLLSFLLKNHREFFYGNLRLVSAVLLKVFFCLQFF